MSFVLYEGNVTIRNREQIINTLRIAKNLNSPENDTNARYGFDITTIDNILLYCHVERDTNMAKEYIHLL